MISCSGKQLMVQLTYGLTQSLDQSSETKNGTDAEAWHCGQWLSAHNPQCPSESQRAS